MTMTQTTATTSPTTAVDTQIAFDEGIIGVPRARRFELLIEEGSPVYLLRCLDIPGFNLPVVDPRLADPTFAPDMIPRLAAVLQIEPESELLMLAVTTLEPEGPVANLRAPLIINVTRRIGAQVILEDRTLPLRAKVRTT